MLRRTGIDNRGAVDVDGDGDLAHEIKEVKDYYPFGLTINYGINSQNSMITGRQHNYGFGGKEEQSELGLEWTDVSARNYDPALARWMNLDPLAEKMTRHSPYNFGFNNPIFFQDYDGMSPTGCCGDFVKGWNKTVRSFNRSVNNGIHNLVTKPLETVATFAASSLNNIGQLVHDAIPGLSDATGMENKTHKAIMGAARTIDNIPNMSEAQLGSVTAGAVILLAETLIERKVPTVSKTSKGADFVVTPDGTTVSTDLNKISESFDNAGFNKVETNSKNSIYEVPKSDGNGTFYSRVQEGNNPRKSNVDGNRVVNTQNTGNTANKQYVNPNGSNITGNPTKSERRAAGHIQLEPVPVNNQ